MCMSSLFRHSNVHNAVLSSAGGGAKPLLLKPSCQDRETPSIVEQAPAIPPELPSVITKEICIAPSSTFHPLLRRF